MMDLDDLEREAGLDPDSPDSRLRRALAHADDDLLERLVAMRKAKGLTQQVVADRMRRDKAAVSNFERLSADPHLSTIRRYAAAVGAVVSHDVRDADAIKPAHYAAYCNDLVSEAMKQWQLASRTQHLAVDVAWSAASSVQTSNVISLAKERVRRRSNTNSTTASGSTRQSKSRFYG